jgi:ribosomal protein S18 acetylase RimI-like enzyme
MTQAVSLRRATAADLPAIVAMLADDALGAKREDTSMPLAEGYARAFAAIEADPNQMLVVGEIDGAVVATMQLSFLPGLSHQGAWRGQIEAVRVAGNRRSEGIGATMIDWAIAQCRARGCRQVQLTTDRSRADAHRFYERLGFGQTHLGYKLVL